MEMRRRKDPARSKSSLMLERLPSILLSLFAAFFVAIASFVISAGYAEHRAAEIDAAATSLAENATPSIMHLAAARAELRHTQALLSDLVNDAALGRPRDRRELDEARDNLSRSLDAYLGMPVYPRRAQAVADRRAGARQARSGHRSGPLAGGERPSGRGQQARGRRAAGGLQLDERGGDGQHRAQRTAGRSSGDRDRSQPRSLSSDRARAQHGERDVRAAGLRGGRRADPAPCEAALAAGRAPGAPSG